MLAMDRWLADSATGVGGASVGVALLWAVTRFWASLSLWALWPDLVTDRCLCLSISSLVGVAFSRGVAQGSCNLRGASAGEPSLPLFRTSTFAFDKFSGVAMGAVAAGSVFLGVEEDSGGG